LLIEDDARIAGELRRVLEGEGWKVLLAESGEAGLAQAVEKKCDLVITDFRLPGASGMEVLRRLHAAQPRLPVILMTAHGTTDTAIEATKLGAYDYLPKPFEIPELLGLVRKALASSRLMFAPVTLGSAEAGRDAIVGRAARCRRFTRRSAASPRSP
jgi:DNA-binding NtrC family response regulator